MSSPDDRVSESAPALPGDHPAALSERAVAMLRFEGRWFTEDGDKVETVRARFGCSLEDYNLELSRVIDHPAALDLDPLVVRRLRRGRERRRRAHLDGTSAEAGSTSRA